ncbi:MAG TPA: hypothetical protein ENN28_02010 [Candidatus Uhrbacteria bacterium]|nr:hypothetical protein [Candidatus Uhrbacteria bacterium]
MTKKFKDPEKKTAEIIPDKTVHKQRIKKIFNESGPILPSADAIELHFKRAALKKGSKKNEE